MATVTKPPISEQTETQTESAPTQPGQMAAESVSPKSRLATTILAWVLGGLGVDRFYTGHIALGIVKLLTGGGFGIWWLIDFIMAVAGKRKDKQGRLISKW
jgi:predicted lipid-binding transport protein (Tim44 family)